MKLKAAYTYIPYSAFKNLCFKHFFFLIKLRDISYDVLTFFIEIWKRMAQVGNTVKTP